MKPKSNDNYRVIKIELYLVLETLTKLQNNFDERIKALQEKLFNHRDC